MLSIIHRDARITVKLSGRLTGSNAEDFGNSVFPATAVDIDLSGVTFVDREGEQSLVCLRNRGATFRGEGLLARALCRRMHLPRSP